MRPSADLLPMAGPDTATPRGLGAFVMAIKPDAFLEPEMFAAGMKHYLDGLRSSTARTGETVMAPGDREWAEYDRRSASGVPIDPLTAESLAALAARFGLPLPFEMPAQSSREAEKTYRRKT
jgi:LDH2 family malate/lactate/ureidoglycolate dehydrogenase